MTCKERLAKEFPENIDKNLHGGCVGCPHSYGYLDDPEWCTNGYGSYQNCERCWDREIPEETKKEKPMATKKTKAELMEELEAANKAKDDLEKQLAELEKYKTYRTAGDELKSIHTAFMDAGFDTAQAMNLLTTMMMTSVTETMTRDLRKVARR